MGKLLVIVVSLPLGIFAADLVEYKGEVGEKSGWRCVGSEAGKVVYLPFEGYYE